jgi:hypothetical protein
MTPLRRIKQAFIFLMGVLVCFTGCKHQVRFGLLVQPIRISSEDIDAAEPAIASSHDGNVYITWVSHYPDGKANVMMARLDSSGQMQSTPVRVNPQPGIAKAWRGDPPTITISPDQTIFISWTAKVESDSGQGTDLFLSASRDQGRTFTAVKVNDDKKPASHGMHSMVVGEEGRVYVAWLDERNIAPMPAMDPNMNQATKGHHMESNSEVFIASSADGGRTFSANRRVASDVCPCCKTALAVTKNGRVYLSWRQVLPGNFRHIAVSASSDQAQTFSTPKIVSDDQWMLEGCPVSGPSIAVNSKDALEVLWYSAGKNGETGLYSSESTDGGNSFGARILVGSGEARGTPVLVNNGTTLNAVWEDASGHIVTTTLEANTKNQDNRIALADGAVPAAVETSTTFVTAYMAKAHQGSIWVLPVPVDHFSARR